MDDLKVKSFELRRHVLDMIMKARAGHIGGGVRGWVGWV